MLVANELPSQVWVATCKIGSILVLSEEDDDEVEGYSRGFTSAYATEDRLRLWRTLYYYEDRRRLRFGLCCRGSTAGGMMHFTSGIRKSNRTGSKLGGWRVDI